MPRIRIKEDELNPYFWFENSDRTSWGRMIEVTDEEFDHFDRVMWQFRLVQKMLHDKYHKRGMRK
jgi:hypothetical protein